MDSVKYVLIAMLTTEKKKRKERKIKKKSQEVKDFPYQGQHLHCKTIKIVLNQLNTPIFNGCKAQGSKMEGHS